MSSPVSVSVTQGLSCSFPVIPIFLWHLGKKPKIFKFQLDLQGNHSMREVAWPSNLVPRAFTVARGPT